MQHSCLRYASGRFADSCCLAQAAAKKAPPGSGGLQVARVTLLAGWAQLVAADRGLVCGTIVCICSKFVWSFLLLFQLAVVERSESARCLKAKYFGALTSRGKSRRWGLVSVMNICLV
eukprot:COSAG01_NODE_417_length_17291_cov_610.598825_20_plen_118_part_00